MRSYSSRQHRQRPRPVILKPYFIHSSNRKLADRHKPHSVISSTSCSCHSIRHNNMHSRIHRRCTSLCLNSRRSIRVSSRQPSMVKWNWYRSSRSWSMSRLTHQCHLTISSTISIIRAAVVVIVIRIIGKISNNFRATVIIIAIQIHRRCIIVRENQPHRLHRHTAMQIVIIIHIRIIICERTRKEEDIDYPVEKTSLQFRIISEFQTFMRNQIRIWKKHIITSSAKSVQRVSLDLRCDDVQKEEILRIVDWFHPYLLLLLLHPTQLKISIAYIERILFYDFFENLDDISEKWQVESLIHAYRMYKSNFISFHPVINLAEDARRMLCSICENYLGFLWFFTYTQHRSPILIEDPAHTRTISRSIRVFFCSFWMANVGILKNV